MQYTIRVEIDLPRAEVFECYTNPNLYSTWMESLVSMEILQGEPGEVGTRTQMAHKMGKREIGMLETVTHREFPSRSVATYEADGVWNQVINHFEEIEGGGTAWVMETDSVQGPHVADNHADARHVQEADPAGHGGLQGVHRGPGNRGVNP
jgi:uncharacterized protein YndB with AHSA1/START domain